MGATWTESGRARLARRSRFRRKYLGLYRISTVCCRCGSDACPGRNDVLDCPAVLGKEGDARMEARQFLLRRYF